MTNKYNGGPDSDRELLEMAARAAGIARSQWDYEWLRALGHMVCRSDMWSPLTDDGDALRLACTLRLNIHVWDNGEDVSVAKTLPGGDNPADGMQEAWYAEDASHSDIYAATRRAIVRAAAAIGSAM